MFEVKEKIRSKGKDPKPIDDTLTSGCKGSQFPGSSEPKSLSEEVRRHFFTEEMVARLKQANQFLQEKKDQLQ